MRSPFVRKSCRFICLALFVLVALGAPSNAAAQTASVSGTVTAAVGGALAGVTINVTRADGTWAGGGNTDSNGRYTVSGLTNGTYYLTTNNGQGYIDEVWNNVYCLSCNPPSTGAAVNVTGPIGGIDFALDPGGRFSGTATDGTNALANISVTLYDAAGQAKGWGWTQADGTYTTSAVPSGAYRIHTWNTVGYIDQAYNGIVCLGCSGTTGELLETSAGAITTGINFALSPGKQFSGHITDMGGVSIAQAGVQLSDAAGNWVGSGSMQLDGTYLTRAVPAGSYRIRTYNSAGYINEVYNDLPCTNCPLTTGPLTSTSQNQVTPNIDFALELGGRIRATITNDVATRLANISIQIYNMAGTYVTGASTDANGVTYPTEGLPGGDYYLRTFNQLGFIDETYDNHTCPDCAIMSGTHITVWPGQTTDIAIALAMGARISGVITAAGAGPLAGANVSVFTTTGQWVGGGFSAADGSYVTGALPGGQYVVHTYNNLGYVDQAYNGIPCVGCANTVGESIWLQAGDQHGNVNFALTAAGRIQGTVTGANGVPVAGIWVMAYNSTGGFVTSVQTNNLGVYQITGLAGGTYYFARTGNGAAVGYIDQLYNGKSCLSVCDPTSGTHIDVSAGATTPANFALTQGGRIGGTVTGTNGVALAGVNVTISDAAGVTVSGANTDANGVYLSPILAPGDYRARTFNSLGYFDQLYDGISCAMGCDPPTGRNIRVDAGTTLVNFALNTGETLTGTILSSAGGPAIGVSMQIYQSITGALYKSGVTNASGVYTITGIPPGTYYMRTSNAVGFIDKVYNTSTTCAPSCSLSAGTTITLQGGTTTASTMTLDPGATLSGYVLDNTTGLGISGVTIFAALKPSSTANFAGTTDNSGHFVSGVISPGEYWVKTSNSAGYVDKIHNNIACFPGCGITSGSIIAVAPGGTASVTFRLDRGIVFTGKMTGPPLSTATRVTLSDFGGNTMSMLQPDTSTGIYRSVGLPPGTYYLSTTNSSGYVDQIADGVMCVPFCSPTTGTPLTPPAGTTVTKNFDLQLGGQVSGTITNQNNAGIKSASVSLQDANGVGYKSASSLADGSFTITGVATGSYFVRASATGYAAVLYNGIACVGCSAPGTPGATKISVTQPNETTGVNFQLTAVPAFTGKITGKITDALSTLPVANVPVVASAISSGVSGGSTISGVDGSYTISGLATGAYGVRATGNTNSYVSKWYPNVSCANCGAPDGTPVLVTDTYTTANINIALEKGGSISGSVTDAFTDGPLQFTSLEFLNGAGSSVSSTTSLPTGAFTSSTLPTGTYFVRARNTSSATAYVTELWDDITCEGCNPLLGRPVTVAANATTPGITFALARGSRIRGYVRTAAGPLITASVNIYSAAGRLVTTASPDSGGYYFTREGLAAGTYFAMTSASGVYLSQLYGRGDCFPSCAPTSGAPISVVDNADTSGIDFMLTPGGRISGTITRSDTGLPVSSVSVQVIDGSGTVVSSGTSSPNGNGVFTTTRALPAGNYRVVTSNGQGLINQVYGGGPCVGCDPVATGTPVAVALGTTTTGIDFSLTPGGRISGKVTNAQGNPLRNVSVLIYAAPYTRAVTSGTTDAFGNYTISGGLPDGAYVAKTANSIGYINAVWTMSNGRSCLGDCALSTGDPIGVTGTATTAGINFVLDTDADDDGDGIKNSIDRDPVTLVSERNAASSGFSDEGQGGSSAPTSGTIADKAGWTVSIADPSSGVQAGITGAGSGPARLTVCGVGNAEEIRLRANTDAVSFTCASGTGSTTVRALAASPKVELRKTVGGITTVIELSAFQTATLGSPAAADASNTDSIVVRLFDAITDQPLGSYTLDPGEAAEAVLNAQGNIAITAISGSVTATRTAPDGTVIGGATIGEGQAETFPGPDTTAPTISTPGNLTAEATSTAGATVNFTVTATDNIDGAVAVTCSGGSGTFAFGTTTITCSATDAHHNTGTASFTVTVSDTTAPTIATMANMTVAAPSAAGVAVTYTAPLSHDAVDGDVAATCTPASGSTFTVGATTVTCTRTDAHLNTGSSSFLVTVTFTAPTTTLPGAMHGEGVVKNRDDKYHFDFDVREGVPGRPHNRFTLEINYGKRTELDKKGKPKSVELEDSRFRATTFDSVVFSDDPMIRSRRSTPPQADTVVFSGRGEWNGRAGYTFEVRAADEGEPGHHRESISIVIRDASGAIVAVADGTLASGNVQSVRIHGGDRE